MVSTDFTKQSVNSENYMKSIATSDVLLLEGGDKLLHENGTDTMALENIDLNSTNFTNSIVNSTDYT